jgi:hypothetical protein
MIMRNKNSIEAEFLNLLLIKTHVGKSIAVPAERVFENRVEGDPRAVAFEYISSMQDSRNL